MSDNQTIQNDTDMLTGAHLTLVPKTALTPPRPSYVTYDYPTQFGAPGLYYHTSKCSGDEIELIDIRISSPIRVVASVRSEHADSYGRLLKFTTSDNKPQEWVMPMRLLEGRGAGLQSELLDKGCLIFDRKHLNHYLLHQLPDEVWLLAQRTGWIITDDLKCFVLPNKIIGSSKVYFQPTRLNHDQFTRNGTLEGWKVEIGQFCIDNPILQIALSASLSGPLLEPLKRAEGCGIHFMGDSSTGKTTALQAAASVWGNKDYIRTWRGTSNGIESVAASHNATSLILDEISEAVPKEVGRIVYAVGNGKEKVRATKTGGVKHTTEWKLVLISSGERSLSATMEEGNLKIKAGQTVRLLDIPCQRQHGIFDTLHGDMDGRDLSDAIKQSSSTHYGIIGPLFIEGLMKEKVDIKALYKHYKSLPEFTSKDNLEGRAGANFALFALAGELAIEYGLLPWNAGDAIKSAILGYELWKGNREGGQTEDNQILQSIEDFISKYSDSRFSDINDKEAKVNNRAGYYKSELKQTNSMIEERARTYLFTSVGLKEASKGFDLNRVIKALDDTGYLVEKGKDRPAKTTKTIEGCKRLYHIKLPDSDEGSSDTTVINQLSDDLKKARANGIDWG